LAYEHQDFITAVNRAYYAIFYAANALLCSRRLERSKHSGVLAAFRQHFVLVQKQIRTFATILPLISAPKVQGYK